MQYVGQTSRALKIRFGEHYRRIKKPKKIILSYIILDVHVILLATFLYNQ